MGPRLRRWGLFNLVALGGFVLQLATITILTRRYGWSTRYQLAKTTSLTASVGITAVLAGPARLPVELANIAAVLLCALPNFFIAESFVLPGNGPNVVPASIRRALHIH